jgi:hypothetical protein
MYQDREALDTALHWAGVDWLASCYNQGRKVKELRETNDPNRWTHAWEETDGVVRLIRQKVDSYPFNNIFIETVSVVHTGAPGGPWQALNEGNHIFCHHYINTGHVVWFPLNQSVMQILNAHAPTWARRYIANDGYYTEGRLVNVQQFIHLLRGWVTLHQIAPYPQIVGRMAA